MPLLPAAPLVVLVLSAIPASFANGSPRNVAGIPHDTAGHEHASHITLEQSSSGSTPQDSYFSVGGWSGWLALHIVSEILCWGFLLPIAVALSAIRVRFTLTFQLIFVTLNALALASGLIYNRSTPNLYPGSIHSSAGWAISVIAAVWATTKVAFDLSCRLCRSIRFLRHRHNLSVGRTSAGILPFSTPNSGAVASTAPTTQPLLDNGSSYQLCDYTKSLKQPNRLISFSIFPFPHQFHYYLSTGLSFLSSALEWSLLPLGFFCLVSGLSVYFGILRDDEIYNGLAHFIKGGIFFWYGILSLARWMGSLGKIGWAWNTPSAGCYYKHQMPSAEFTESFLLFLYGSINVFLERLGGHGKPWTTQDFEHVSIAFLLFGGGVLGMMVESKAVRDWFNYRIDLHRTSHVSTHGPVASSPALSPLHPSSGAQDPHFSSNPIPALVIFLLGILMSSHHQSSITSTMLHKQWGWLLSAGAMMRVITYLIRYLSPPTFPFPSRPPTELIVSFCLIAGGLTFMESTSSIVVLLDQNSVMPLFVFTVTSGLTALIMAWETVVLALQAWAFCRENKDLLSRRSLPTNDQGFTI